MKNALLRAGQSGIYRSPAAPASLRRTLAAGDLTWVEVDLARVRTKSELLDQFAAACGFPPTFGRNWDALADALQDLSWCPAGGYVLHLAHADAAASVLGGDWPILLEVLAASAMYWSERGKAFVVLVDGIAGLAQWT